MNRFCLIIFISYTLLFSPFNHALAKAAPEEGPSLNKILEGCAEYCERLRHTSFYFVCREEIKETIYRPWFQSEMNKYVYDYQLVRKQGNIKEKRILLSEYGYEHKDIQFPSRFVLKEIYANKRNGRRFIQSEIKVDYKDYRFFIVKTEIEYNR